MANIKTTTKKMVPVRWAAFLVFVCCFATVVSQVDEEESEERSKQFAEAMKYDGVERVVKITDTTFPKLSRRTRLVVLFHAHSKLSDLNQQKHLLEVVAKVFEGKDIVFGVLNVSKYQDVAVRAGVKFIGVIKIFNFGQSSDYAGQRSIGVGNHCENNGFEARRSADVMVPYLSKLFEHPLIEVTSKVRKKQLDAVDLPKVIAYVLKGSKEYNQLEMAARAFQPMIPFYITLENKFAKSFQLKRLNSLIFVKPYEKPLVFNNKVPFEEQNIVDFVRKNKKQIMRKLRLENLHDIWAADRKGFLIPVFARTTEQDGSRFFAIAKKVAKEFAKEERLQFVWIDPEPFPAMREHWRSTFKIDPMEPSLGAVDVSKQASAWLQLTSASEKRETITKRIKQWILQVLSGDVQLTAMNAARDESREGNVNNKEMKDGKEEL